jgi:hypothetical protein
MCVQDEILYMQKDSRMFFLKKDPFCARVSTKFWRQNKRNGEKVIQQAQSIHNVVIVIVGTIKLHLL